VYEKVDKHQGDPIRLSKKRNNKLCFDTGKRAKRVSKLKIVDGHSKYFIIFIYKYIQYTYIEIQR